MSRKIKINCKKVYHTGVLYEKNASDIKNIQVRMKELSNSIKESWNGEDSLKFIAKLEEHINYLDNLVNFLSYKGNLLKTNSVNHYNADNDFMMRIKRSDINES